jgi:hypothetical protein
MMDIRFAILLTSLDKLQTKTASELIVGVDNLATC